MSSAFNSLEGIEISKSNRSSCKVCNKKIKKLEIRGKNIVGEFICSDCLKFDKMIEEIKEFQKEFIRLNKLNPESREGILIKQKVINKLK
jgi:hypothetical protein